MQNYYSLKKALNKAVQKCFIYNSKKLLCLGINFMLVLLMVAAFQSPLFAQTPPPLPQLATGANENVFTSIQETYYVSPAGSDTNPGTSALPFKTFSKGIDKGVERKNAGSSVKIILGDGTYRERKNISPTTSDNTGCLIIEAENIGRAIISGSEDWSGQWQQEGSNWTHTWTFNWGIAPSYIQVRNELGRRRELFFVNKVLYTQVLNQADLTDGTYYVDETGDKAYIRPLAGVDMATALIEVGMLEKLFTINANRKNIAVKGLVFQHEASFPVGAGAGEGALRIGKDCSNILLEDVSLEWNNSAGFGTFEVSDFRQDITFRRVKINNNGGGGFSFSNSQNLLFEDCETSYNRFRSKWAGQAQGAAPGAFKLASTHRTSFIRHKVIGNYGRGMWWDIANRDMTAKDCYVDGNYGSGIFVEYDFGPALIENCTIINTQKSNQYTVRNQGGLQFASTANLTIRNCTIKNNIQGQIKCWDQQRTMTDHLTGEVKRYDSTNVGNVYLRSNMVEATDTSQSIIDIPNWNYLRSTWNSDSNTYIHRQQNTAFRVYKGGTEDGDDGGDANYFLATYYTFQEWKKLINGDANSTFNGVSGPEKNTGVVYPANSGIVHMVDEYGLVASDPTKATFNTAQIQKAIDDNKGQSFGVRSGILYFPNGTYYVNDKMSLGSITEDCRYITFQGQSREGTSIKLADGSAGFGGGANKPIIVFTEASGTNIGFRNYIKNLTIDIGANNPGAVAVDFICNNHGGLFDVTIKSSDNQKRGAIGLKMDRNLGGIGLIKNVRIEGFDIGIKTGSFKINYVFEYLELDGQKVAGIQNTDKPLSIRKLTTTNLGGPAIVNTTAPGHIVLIDSKLNGSGKVAIDNQQGFVFVRNVTTTGYANAISDHDSLITGAYVEEYSSGGVYQLWNNAPAKSLNLAIKETPEVPWEQDLSKWIVVDVAGNGMEDDAPAIQAAIDDCTAANGKNTVCIRVSKDNAGKVVLKTPIVIRGNVQRFLVLGALFQLQEPLVSANGAVFTLETTNHSELLVEGLQFTSVPQSTGDLSILQNNSPKTVILRDMATFNGRRYYRNSPSAGLLFVEIGGHQFTHPQAGGTVGWEFTRQEVWARDINPEDVDVGLVNDGGKLWILGYKFESDITGKPAHHIITKNGGFTEVLGGVDNGVFTEDSTSAVHINDNSTVSHISAERARNEAQRHTVLIREIRGNEAREFRFGDLPSVSNASFIESSVIPLYVGYKHPRAKLTIFGDSRTFTVCDTVKLTAQLIDFDPAAQVAFYAGTQLLGTDTDGTDGYAVSWSGMVAGSHALTVQATDQSGNAATSDTLSLTVQADITPPSIAVKPNPAEIWPPNNKYVTYTIADMLKYITDQCEGNIALARAQIDSVSFNSDRKLKKPGKPQYIIAFDKKSVQLMASKNKKGNQRTYVVYLSVSDTSGNSGTADFKAVVPHHQDRRMSTLSSKGLMISVEKTAALKVFPNPSKGNFTLQFVAEKPGRSVLTISDAGGRNITSISIPVNEGLNTIPLNNSSLAPGVYVLRLKVDGKVLSMKLMLTK